MKVAIYCARPGCGGRAIRGYSEPDELHCVMCGHRVARQEIARQARVRLEEKEAA